MSATTVFWRPGCGFCSGLISSLDRAGLVYDRRNIWEDEDAAAFVRSVANGNEVVPTVTVGDTAMVNPSPRDVMAAVAAEAPDELPEGWEPPQQGKVAGFVTRVLGG